VDAIFVLLILFELKFKFRHIYIYTLNRLFNNNIHYQLHFFPQGTGKKYAQLKELFLMLAVF